MRFYKWLYRVTNIKILFIPLLLVILLSLQIQAANGEVTITNDGATILKQMSVIHPAAKMVFTFCFNTFHLFAD